MNYQAQLTLISFYINLPLSGVTATTLVPFFFPLTRETSQLGLLEKLQHLDLPGFALFSPAVVMVLLAFEWGGQSYPWRSATIIGLLCGFMGNIVLFVLWQWRQQEEGSIPPKILLKRTVSFGAIATFLTIGGLQLITYFLPIWFQVILGVSPTGSGVRYLPTVIANVLISIVSGGFGRYTRCLDVYHGLIFFDSH